MYPFRTFIRTTATVVVIAIAIGAVKCQSVLLGSTFLESRAGEYGALVGEGKTNSCMLESYSKRQIGEGSVHSILDATYICHLS